MKVSSRIHFLALACLSSATILGCGAANGGGTGGTTGMGGSDTGGVSSGGATGGSSSGGTSSGGAAESGGASTGGNSDCQVASDSKYPTLTECSTPSLDRFTEWLGTSEGPTNPGDGSSWLVENSECGDYVARVSFEHSPNWHVAPVWVTNAFSGVDVSSASELRIEYSATADLWVQLRPFSTYSGGAKWHHLLPNTNGARSLLTIPLSPEAWIEKLGTPPSSVADALKELCGLVFVGTANNTIEITSLRIEGYEPPCP